MPKVYVPNRSHHDFTDAERFGELVFLTEGYLNRFNINQIFLQCSEAMKDAHIEDYILISSLSIVNAAAASLMAERFGKLNFLIFDQRRYVHHEVLIRSYTDASCNLFHPDRCLVPVHRSDDV